MKFAVPVVFVIGALAGSLTTWLFVPKSSGGSDKAPQPTPQPAEPVASARNRNLLVQAKSSSDEFLQSFAVRDFGPGGPQLSDFQELLFRQPSMQRTIAFANLLSQLSPESARQVVALLAENANTYDLHRNMNWLGCAGRRSMAPPHAKPFLTTTDGLSAQNSPSEPFVLGP